MELRTYNEASCMETKGLRGPLSIRERLENQKADLENQLKRVNDAIAAMDSAPETARVIELISKV